VVVGVVVVVVVVDDIDVVRCIGGVGVGVGIGDGVSKGRRGVLFDAVIGVVVDVDSDDGVFKS